MRAWFLMGAAGAVFLACQGVMAQEAKLGKSIDLPNVGLSIALPAGMKQEVNDAMNVVLMASDGSPPQWKASAKVIAYRMADPSKMPTSEAVAASVLAQAEKQLSQAPPRRLAGQAARMQGQAAWLLGSKLLLPDGADATATVIVWPRDAAGFMLYYVVLYESRGADANQAAAACKAIADSARYSELKSPPASLAATAGQELELPKGACSVTVPPGWFVGDIEVYDGASLTTRVSTWDCARNLTTPNFVVTVVKARGTMITVDKAYLDSLIGMMKQNNADVRWTLVGSSTTNLAGQNAAQIVARIQPPDQPAATQVTRQAQNLDRVFTLSLTWPGDNVAYATAAMDRIAANFKFLPQRPTTTSKPN